MEAEFSLTPAVPVPVRGGQCNDQDRWIYPDQPVHPPIIDSDTFARAQQFLAVKYDRQIIKRPRTSPRPYVLRGLLSLDAKNVDFGSLRA
jgi:hypothetical protein